MPRKKRDIENALEHKGFRRENTSHHTYFKFYDGEKNTGVCTYTSRGTKHKEYDDSLLTQMVKQLKLDNRKQLLELIDCPMDENSYREILKNKGFLKYRG
jgi:hypothetical protein